jgi:hypothetical protein
MTAATSHAADALDSFVLTRKADDRRADGCQRTVHLSTAAVTIDRVVHGVRMRVGVPVAAYRDLAITVQAPHGRATLTLRHGDGELDVVIGMGEATQVARSARAWSEALGKPVTVVAACIEMGRALPRRRRGRKAPGRALRRRRARGTATAGTSFAGEREIIARD